MLQVPQLRPGTRAGSAPWGFESRGSGPRGSPPPWFSPVTSYPSTAGRPSCYQRPRHIIGPNCLDAQPLTHHRDKRQEPQFHLPPHSIPRRLAAAIAISLLDGAPGTPTWVPGNGSLPSLQVVTAPSESPRPVSRALPSPDPSF